MSGVDGGWCLGWVGLGWRGVKEWGGRERMGGTGRDETVGESHSRIRTIRAQSTKSVPSARFEIRYQPSDTPASAPPSTHAPSAHPTTRSHPDPLPYPPPRPSPRDPPPHAAPPAPARHPTLPARAAAPTPAAPARAAGLGGSRCRSLVPSRAARRTSRSWAGRRSRMTGCVRSRGGVARRGSRGRRGRGCFRTKWLGRWRWCLRGACSCSLWQGCGRKGG
jgi:hypothetical protein